ncbi:hypothetical protein ACFTY9_38820 [Streptomyces sp. NPDC057021]|uniref:hypothetical protein n=1 Tax=Streptomyces sp. NPDC057021 TaxID=3346003 RepID=UPI00362608BE
MITGTGTALGEQAAVAVAQVVRDRLGASDRGQAALADLEESGASSEAQAEASAVLAEEIETDPRLQHALTVHLNAPRAGGVVIHRSRMRGDNPILVGSGTINFRKPTSAAGMVALVLAVLVVLAVIVLAVYGGGRILGSDDSPGSGHGSASATAGKNEASASSNGSDERTITPRALAVAETKDVVPGLEDMPSGWAVSSARNGFPTEGGTGCNAGTANYKNPEKNSGNLTVTYRVTACRDVRTVIGGYAEALKGVATSDPEETRIAMPKCGDESFATSYTVTDSQNDWNGNHVKVRARVGAVYVAMNYGPIGDGPDRLDFLQRAQELMQLVCDRAAASQSTP